MVVPTYRRPEMLRPLLAALAGQVAAAETVEVIVVDNCPDASAGPVCAEAARSLPGLVHVHAPRPGVVHARNAGVAAARGDHVIFLDDDEMPGPDWLASWLAQADAGADAAFGPVVPRYEADPGVHREILDRMFSRCFGLPTGADVGGQLVRLGTGNSMFRRLCLAGGRTFDAGFNATGGEDLHLIGQLAARGVPLVWNREAWVAEVVPAERMTLAYLKRRRFNQAQLRCLLMLRGGGPLAWPKVAAWMLVGAAQAGLNGARYLAARLTGGPRREVYDVKLQGGLGKLLWYRAAGGALYAAKAEQP